MCPPPWAIYAVDVNSALVYAPSARSTTTFAFVYTFHFLAPLCCSFLCSIVPDHVKLHTALFDDRP